MTGAIWYDGNGDGSRNPARQIAEKIAQDTAADPARTILSLTKYHRSFNLQAAELLHMQGVDLNSTEIKELTARLAGAEVRAAFEDYWTAWRDSEIARSTQSP